MGFYLLLRERKKMSNIDEFAVRDTSEDKSKIFVDENSRSCFDNALSEGLFNRFEMLYFKYMYSKEGRDYFKHQNTRNYVSCQRGES